MNLEQSNGALSGLSTMSFFSTSCEDFSSRCFNEASFKRENIETHEAGRRNSSFKLTFSIMVSYCCHKVTGVIFPR